MYPFPPGRSSQTTSDWMVSYRCTGLFKDVLLGLILGFGWPHKDSQWFVLKPLQGWLYASGCCHTEKWNDAPVWGCSGARPFCMWQHSSFPQFWPVSLSLPLSSSPIALRYDRLIYSWNKKTLLFHRVIFIWHGKYSHKKKRPYCVKALS